MSKQSGFIWTVCCASNSVSPTCGRSHGPIASSIPLRAVPLLLGGKASDSVAQAQGSCPSRGKFSRWTALHGLSDEPRADVSSAGPCAKDPSERLLASVEVACDSRDEDRATDIVPLGMLAKLVSASPALSQVNIQTCIPCEQHWTRYLESRKLVNLHLEAIYVNQKI